MDHFEHFPETLCCLILEQLELPDLRHVALTGHKLCKVCLDQQFWIYKYITEFNKPFPNETHSQPNISQIEYISQKMKSHLQQFDSLEQTYLGKISNIYLSASNSVNSQNAFDQTFKITKTHKFVEWCEVDDLDFLSKSSTNQQIDSKEQGISDVYVLILVILIENGLRSGINYLDFFKLIYFTMIEYRQKQNQINKVLKDFNWRLQKLAGENFKEVMQVIDTHVEQL